ncbi:MAG: hypothetical protein JWL63_3094 [Rhodocyclales bacterium]|nr:hypothetical protein [Rhodocyclales bacterium]
MNTPTSLRILPYLWYPLFMAAALVMFGTMLAAGWSPMLAAYTPITLTALAIVALELRLPERNDWRPRLPDIRADAAFMAFVQIAVPRLLAATLVLVLAAWRHGRTHDVLWPHHWPLALQILAMVLSVDFMRYWLHRACHHFNPLWGLHEVHHSPDILYVLNVARFHPFEKVLHFSLDTVPFLLLGVAPEVIAGYFLLYSVNGFFQHSNLRLRYGWLNYLVGSAETHRWHHARDPKTASCNFGNTTIVWDLLFGTWYLHRNNTVNDIGIMNRHYPKGFLAQMTEPFRRNGGIPQRSFKTWLADTLVTLSLRLRLLTRGWHIATMLRQPMRVQNELLARILRENCNTRFGREHGFSRIQDYSNYAQRVPFSDYEALRPFIDAEIERDECALSAEKPLRYVRTSGTTGRPKDVPLTNSHLRSLQHIHRMAVAFQQRTCPEAFSGGVLAIVSPAYEGLLANGKPFGSASGIIARNTPAAIREKFVVPAIVMTVQDSFVKYLLILRLALARPDITYIGAANPTTLLMLAKLYRAHHAELIDDLRHGTFFLADKVPVEVLAAIHKRLRALPERATALAQLPHGTTRIADLWPSLRLIVTWTCASAGVAVDALRHELTKCTRVLELGYVSSEFRGTITLGKRSGSGLPTLDTHFFEFVERDKWDNGKLAFVTLDGLRKGADYYIFVTTPSGLYRYFINDLVRVTGFLHKTPLLQFVQKGKGVTNITGEKLYEAQVLMAVRATLAHMGRTARFVMMLADEQASRYRLYVETDRAAKPTAMQLAEAVDTKLANLNIEYQAKRESDRLQMLEAYWLLPNTGEVYKQQCIKQGQREGQFKTVALAYRKDYGFDLDAHIERSEQ